MKRKEYRPLPCPQINFTASSIVYLPRTSILQRKVWNLQADRETGQIVARGPFQLSTGFNCCSRAKTATFNFFQSARGNFSSPNLFPPKLAPPVSKSAPKSLVSLFRVARSFTPLPNDLSFVARSFVPLPASDSLFSTNFPFVSRFFDTRFLAIRPPLWNNFACLRSAV